MVNDEIEKKKKKTEQFFADAFCGKSARFLTPDEAKEYEPYGTIEIDTGDKRGKIYLANMKRI